ncbi:MAG TPA: cytochrome c oxidase subunit II [Gaiellaceae bacterium]|nr:cytochrome c oxidase subunit II [Gaiellaceae bacterium]
MRKRSIIQMVLVGAAVGVALALVAVLIPWLPPSDSKEAVKVDHVYWFVTVICAAIFALVAGVSLFAVWKFRAPPDDTEDGAPIHGHTGLEVVWTAIPAVLVTAITVYSGVVLTQIEDIPKDHRVVEVTGQQFTWSFHYPDGDVTSGQLALPVDEPVELRLTAKDVIHSFWVPEWRMKKDAVPGIDTDLVITPTKQGTYTVICTELCGLGHATMRAQALVMSRSGFDKWLADEKAKAAQAGSAAGKTLFTQQCGTCHTLADAGTQGEVGPDLDKVLAGKNADFVHESIVNPNDEIASGYQPDVMPGNFADVLTDQQLQSLVDYLLDTAGKS